MENDCRHCCAREDLPSGPTICRHENILKDYPKGGRRIIRYPRQTPAWCPGMIPDYRIPSAPPRDNRGHPGRFTDHQIQEIRNSKETRDSLAAFYEVSHVLIWKIQKRLLYKHVPEKPAQDAYAFYEQTADERLRTVI